MHIIRFTGLAVLAAVLAAPLPAAADITVPCPGTMVDSSAAITAAMQSIGPGGTVRLEPCTYYLSAPVVITGTFDGALVGAGMGRTILTTLPDADGIEDVLMRNWISDLDAPGVRGPTLAPTLFHFSLFGDGPSHVAMSNLTITITDLHPAPASARAEWFGDALLAMITVEGKWVSTDFDQLGFTAVPGHSALGGNVLYGIEMWGEMSYWPNFGTQKPLTGNHVLRRSVFDGIATAAYDAEGMVDSHVMVRENRIVNPVYFGFMIAAMEASTVHVTQNDIALAGGAVGLLMDSLDGALINQNRFSGLGGPGVYALSGTRYSVLNNDFGGLVVPPGSFLIVLEAPTSNSLVVGTAPALVLDEGTHNRVLAGKAKR